MRAVLRAGALWLVVTVVVVLGVTEAIESVHRDVTARRPVPMSTEEVDRQARARTGTTTATTPLAPPPATSPTAPPHRGAGPAGSTTVPAAGGGSTPDATTSTTAPLTTTSSPGPRRGHEDDLAPHAPASPPTSTGGPSSGTNGR